ncbi:uncharacterized protein DS421_3g80660 [Arachis hypogaea]|nr:uncharacterized protein DS421_3g80660 [Arachis hypogaea]
MLKKGPKGMNPSLTHRPTHTSPLEPPQSTLTSRSQFAHLRSLPRVSGATFIQPRCRNVRGATTTVRATTLHRQVSPRKSQPSPVPLFVAQLGTTDASSVQPFHPFSLLLPATVPVPVSFAFFQTSSL